jgi:hypothetical protein
VPFITEINARMSPELSFCEATLIETYWEIIFCRKVDDRSIYGKVFLKNTLVPDAE